MAYLLKLGSACPSSGDEELECGLAGLNSAGGGADKRKSGLFKESAAFDGARSVQLVEHQMMTSVCYLCAIP